MTLHRGNVGPEREEGPDSLTEEEEKKLKNKEVYREMGSGISSLQEKLDEFVTDSLNEEQKETVGLLKSHLFVAGRLMKDLKDLGR